MQYENFLLKLYKDPAPDGRYQAQVLVPPTADGGRFVLPLTPADLAELREQSAAVMGYAEFAAPYRQGLGYANLHSAVQHLAAQLAAQLPADLRGAIRASLTAALERGRGLRLGWLIDPSAAALASLPWELYWDPEWSGGYLAPAPASPIVRLVPTSFPPPHWPAAGPPATLRSINGPRFTLAVPLTPAPPRRVLVALVGAEAGLQVAGAFAEAAAIKRALHPQTHVTILDPPLTLADLEAALRARPYQVLHLITHGHADTSSALAHLLFDPPTGPDDAAPREPDPVISARLLGVLQGRPGLELIVFSACRAGAALQPRGPAAALLTMPSVAGAGAFLTPSLGGQIAGGTGIPVVAMQFDLLAPAELLADDPTRSWAGAFYGALARGAGVDGAVAAARRVLKADRDPLLWVAPALFVPLYWVAPPPPLYERLDRRLYGVLAAANEGQGQGLDEGVLIAGLLVVAGLAMAGLLTPPADPGDRVGVFHVALALFLTVAVLPAALGGSVVVLAARRRPAWRAWRGRAAGMALLTAYAGAGAGVLTGVLGLSVLALVVAVAGQTHPLLAAVLGLLLQIATVSGSVALGLVYAGRAVRVGRSVAGEDEIYPVHPVVGWSPLLLGTLLALSLPLWYDWLRAGPALLAGIAAVAVAGALWRLRRPLDPPG
jgi:hypothetical protein